jgi:hypothetical protein
VSDLNASNEVHERERMTPIDVNFASVGSQAISAQVVGRRLLRTHGIEP